MGGYRGRIGVYELLMMDSELSRKVAARASEEEVRLAALERGLLLPFAADAQAKVAAGLTTVEEAARVLGSLAGVPMGPRA